MRTARLTGAFLAVAFLAACSSTPKLAPRDQMMKSMDELRVAAATTVKGPQRVELVTIIERFRDQYDASEKQTQAHYSRLRATDLNYDATPEDFRKVFREFNDARSARQALVLEQRDRMIMLTDADEWKKIAGKHEAALASMARINLLAGEAGTLPLVSYLPQTKEVAGKIADGSKRRAAVAAADELKESEGKFEDAEQKAVKAVTRIAAERRARRADFMPALTEHRHDAAQEQDRIMQIHFKMKSQFNREEWAAARATRR